MERDIKKNIIDSFLTTLKDDDLLIELFFDDDCKSNSKTKSKLYFNNTLYSIDDNYKIKDVKKNKKTNDYLNGYYFNGKIHSKSLSLKKIDFDDTIQLMEKAKKEDRLYGLPLYKINKNKKLNKCLFLDRDGIIMKDVGYIGTTERVIFNEWFFDIIKYANERDVLVIIVTNQAGVSYGYYSEKDVCKVHSFIFEEFKRHGAVIDDFFYCPYHAKGNKKKYIKETLLRKPNPAMILQAATKYNIDITQSIMIGDRDTDIIKLPYLKTCLIETNVYKIENKDLIISIDDIKKIVGTL